jgi:D-arabinose 1-dehydrogenase-like Zn-dependent alcohol dehydrogenase
MRDMPDPRLGRHEVAVKVLRVGLCATDKEIDSDTKPFGVVEDVGRSVKDLKLRSTMWSRRF